MTVNTMDPNFNIVQKFKEMCMFSFTSKTCRIQKYAPLFYSQIREILTDDMEPEPLLNAEELKTGQMMEGEVVFALFRVHGATTQRTQGRLLRGLWEFPPAMEALESRCVVQSRPTEMPEGKLLCSLCVTFKKCPPRHSTARSDVPFLSGQALPWPGHTATHREHQPCLGVCV
ncbi:hypothetical protein H1C71_035037 [Ictidomys tridecemlineatus]|nr:hypothetical protein H1C71_035037 [Ictidomys tridecemlineatus]